MRILLLLFFFFNDPATPEIYPLSLHDALPIFHSASDTFHGDPAYLDLVRGEFEGHGPQVKVEVRNQDPNHPATKDRKSTRLNSSHANISYAVFCLKKKNTTSTNQRETRPEYKQ